MQTPKRSNHAPFGGSAPRLGLTPALTGTAPAARSEENGRLNLDGGRLDPNRGCVRGRMLRLGQMTLLLDATLGATGFGEINGN